MEQDALSAALEREHREIDEGIAASVAAESGTGGIAALTGALTALRRHIYLEEELLFPSLRDQLVAPLFVMLREHGQMWSTMAELEKALADEDEASVREVRAVLMSQLDTHNGKEEPIIYPYADTALPAEQAARLREFLASGDIPAGWTCHAARA
ncbi:MAG TPA: hemerythrin domain-containing protein [Mycobacteriales bacterium]